MDYQQANYIKWDLSHYPIDYTWDDTEVEEKLDYSYAKSVTNSANTLTKRAQFLLRSGIYEWVLARLKGVCNEPIFFQISEAAYCANINKYYYDLEVELDRHEFIGPINGALWCAGYSSVLSYYSWSVVPDDGEYGYEDYPEDEWQEEDLNFLISLVIHILPESKHSFFKDWLEGVITRLGVFYTQKKEKLIDPFDNLFGYEPKDDFEWFGDYIGKEILDLEFDYHPEQAVMLCDNYLQTVDYKKNPLLLSPSKLKKKIKQPYRLIVAK